MSFLYLSKGKVRCTEDGFTLKEVKEIWNNDKTGKEKTFFNDVITGLYYIYTPRTVYSNKTTTERIDIVNKEHLKNSTWDIILKRNGVKALVEKYKDLTLTINERMMDLIRDDFKELSKLQESVPMVVRFTLSDQVEFLDDEGVIRKTMVKKEIEIPNVEKKTELYQAYLNMAKMIDQITKLLIVEEDQRAKEEDEKRMFDSRNKFVQPEEDQI